MFNGLPRFNCKVIQQTNFLRQKPALRLGSSFPSAKVNGVQTPLRDDDRAKNLDDSKLNSKQIEEVDGTGVVQNDLLRLPQATYTTSFANNFELPVASSPGLITSQAWSDRSFPNPPEPLTKSKLSAWLIFKFYAFKICRYLII